MYSRVPINVKRIQSINVYMAMKEWLLSRMLDHPTRDVTTPRDEAKLEMSATRV
jgi:hypothetical protein